MPSSMPVAAKPRPYRRLLTSALHTRFVHAVGLALLWHLCVAGFASDWYTSIPSVFWAFFPLGKAGIKALLFSLSSLSIFMLQIATFQIGKRCTPSTWTSIRTILLSYSTYATVFWYMASAWWFCEVFVFTSPASTDLGWIINGGYGAPDKLNERPIYLRLFFLLLGAMQATLHIYNDSSSLPLPVRKAAKPQDSAEEKAEDKTIMVKMLGTGPGVIRQATSLSAVASVTGPFLYTSFFRRTLWTWHVWWARVFANIARSEAEPPTGFYIGSIMVRAFIFGVFLSVTWQLNILLFQSFMLREPTKDSKPLSASSKDPNGTLLHGLKAKRELVRTFAFWELETIAKKFPDRRRDIFGDFERPNQAPIFSQMLSAALEVLTSIQSRTNVLDPPPNVSSATTNMQDEHTAYHLPRLLPSAVPARNQIYQPPNPGSGESRTGRLVSYASHEAKLIGNSPNPWSPPLEKGKRLAIEYSSPTVKDLQARAEAARQSPLGRYLLTTPIRLIKSAILGTPNGNPALTVYAASSISAMLVASLTEDTFGKAVQGVPLVVQTITTTIFAIEDFVHKHTVRGIVSSSDAKELKDVTVIHAQLKASLQELLSAFQLFLADVGLSIRDLNDAMKAAEGQELFQIVRPTETPSAISESLHDRTKLEGGAIGNRREMQEVSKGQQPQQREKERQQQDERASGRRKQQGESDVSVDRSRPGRIFPQLDRGSSYQASLQERRKSISKGDVQDVNPLTSGSKKAAGNAAMSENPFGARDFNSLPAGGLQQRRRVGPAR